MLICNWALPCIVKAIYTVVYSWHLFTCLLVDIPKYLLSERCSVVSDFLWPHGLYSPWNSLGQNTGMGSLSFLQGIFPTQRSNSGLLHCRQILYQLSHKGSPRILEWVAYPFSSRSSRPRNQTGVSCIAGRIFTNWAIRAKKLQGFLVAQWVKNLPSMH